MKIKQYKIAALLLVLFALIANNLKAQTFDWLRKAGGASNEVVYDNVVSKIDGAMYVTGTMGGVATFTTTGTTYTLTSKGSTDMFLAKYDKQGNVLWALSDGGTNIEIAYSIGLDRFDNVYVGGSFVGTITFNGTTTYTSTSNAQDAFIAKYNKDGVFQWIDILKGGGITDRVTSINVLHDSLYIAGTFGNATAGTAQKLSIDGDTVTSKGRSDLFLCKMDLSGGTYWLKNFGGGQLDNLESIFVKNNNIYLGGSFNSTIATTPKLHFGISPHLAALGALDGFVAKLDLNGNGIWQKQYGGTDSDAITQIAVDDNDNVFVGGYFSGTSNFEIATYTAPNPNNLNPKPRNLIYFKLNSSGAMQWIKQGGGKLLEDVSSISLNTRGDMFVSVYYDSDTCIVAGTDTIISGGADDGFVLKVNKDDGTIEAKARIYGVGYQKLDAGDIDEDGNYYGAGSFSGSSALNAYPYTVNAVGSSYSDIFITKFSPISIGSVNGDVLCNLSTYTVPFQSNIVTNSGNVFSVELSNSSGSFSSPTIIGTLSSTTVGTSTINCTIPSSLTAGTGYKIRIKSSNPSVNGVSHNVEVSACFDLDESLFCWARNAISTHNTGANAIITDADGNSYITGYYAGGETDLDGVVFPVPPTGKRNLFVAKYSPDGGVIWAKRVFTEVGNSEGLGISLYGNNVYVTGYFDNPMYFNEIATTLIPIRGEDIFYACFSATNGNQIAAKSGGGDGNDRGLGINANSDYVLITGYYGEHCSFGSLSLTGEGNKDGFILKANATGLSEVWLKKIGGTSNDEGKSITFSKTGSCVVTGFFSGNLISPSSITGGGVKDFFIAKYTSSGTLSWIKSGGDNNDQEGLSVCSDPDNGDSYITGYFFGSAYFSPVTTLTVSAPNVGTNSDVFIAKYDLNGDAVWAKQTSGTEYDQGMSISFDKTYDNIFVTGYYSNTLSVSGIASPLADLGDKNVFVLKTDLTGTPKLFLSAGDQYDEIANGVSSDDDNNIYITGSFVDESQFGNIALQTASTTTDLFVAKICYENTCSTSLEEAGTVVICQGVEVPLELIELPDIRRNLYGSVYSPPLSSYSWTPSTGMSVDGDQLIVSPSSNTTYTVTVTNFNGCVSTFTAAVQVVSYSLTPGIIATSTSVCYGEPAPTLTNSSSPTGGPYTPGYYAYFWEASTNGTSYTVVQGNYVTTLTTVTTTSSYTPTGPLTATTYYRRNVISGNCGIQTSNVVTVTVVAPVVVSSITTYNPVVCYGVTQPQLVLSAGVTGGVGTYTLQWQQSTNNSTFTDISGATTSSYTPTTPTTDGTVYYRLKATSGGCIGYNSSTYITTLPQLTAGSLSLSSSPCQEGIAVTIYLTGTTGGTSYTYQWEYSTNLSTWSNVSGATASYLSTISSYTNAYYRVKVTTSDNCTATTSYTSVNGNVLNPGTISTNQFICYGALPAALTNSSSAISDNGTISYQWQSSLDGINWQNISSATVTTYSPSTLTTTTLYRRGASTGTCDFVYSNTVTIDVAEPINLLPFNSVVLNTEVFMIGGTPLGGTYTVNGTPYYPTYTASTLGTQTVTYAVEVNGCYTYTSQNFVVMDVIEYEYTAEPTTGISFNNYGAYVFLSKFQIFEPGVGEEATNPYLLSDSTQLNAINIVGNLLNENAAEERSYDSDVKGIFINNGAIRVTKDWTNNAGVLFPSTYTVMSTAAISSTYFITTYNHDFETTTYTNNYGLVEFNGENQGIKGTYTTEFYDVNLKGTGIKRQYINANINSNLDLKHLELATQEYTLLLKNPANDAIRRTHGFVSSNLYGGKLSRTIDNSDPYLFPLGSSENNIRYRPVVIRNQYDGDEFAFDARLINNTPSDPEDYNSLPTTQSSHLITKKYQDVYQITDKYYYKLEKNGQLGKPTDLGFFYLPVVDGDYNGIAVWSTNPVTPTIFTSATNTPPYWKNTRSPFLLPADVTTYDNIHDEGFYNAMNMLAVKQWNFINNETDEKFFALEKAGFVINTGGGFGGGSTTNMLVTGPCEPDGSDCSNSVYGNTNGNAEGSDGGVFTNLPLAGTYCFVYDENIDNTLVKICFEVDEIGIVSNPVVHQSGITTLTTHPALADDLYEIVNGTTLLLKADPLQNKLCDFSSPAVIDFTDGTNHSSTTLKSGYSLKINKNSTSDLDDIIQEIVITKRGGGVTISPISGSTLTGSTNTVWNGLVSGVSYPGVYDIKIEFKKLSGTKEFYGQFIVE